MCFYLELNIMNEYLFFSVKYRDRRQRHHIWQVLTLRLCIFIFWLKIDFRFFWIFAQRVFKRASQQIEQRCQYGLSKLNHLERNKNQVNLYAQQRDKYENTKLTRM